MRPTQSLFNVFAVAAEEVNVAETIKKQLFSPDHQDDKPKRTVRATKRTVRATNVRSTRGRKPTRQSARLRGRGRGKGSTSPPATPVKAEPLTPPPKG